MIGKSVLLLPLCLVSVCRGSRLSDSEVDCTSYNTACSVNDGNIIDAVGDIPGPEDCHWLGLNQEDVTTSLTIPGTVSHTVGSASCSIPVTTLNHVRTVCQDQGTVTYH